MDLVQDHHRSTNPQLRGYQIHEFLPSPFHVPLNRGVGVAEASLRQPVEHPSRGVALPELAAPRREKARIIHAGHFLSGSQTS